MTAHKIKKPVNGRCPYCGHELIPHERPCRLNGALLWLGDCSNCGATRTLASHPPAEIRKRDHGR